MAVRPHGGADSYVGTRDLPFDTNELHWRTNSSYSPSVSRRQDLRFQSDGSPDEFNCGCTYGASVSLGNKGNRDEIRNDHRADRRCPISHATLYFGRPSDSFNAFYWTPPMQRFNTEDLSSRIGGTSEGSGSMFYFSSLIQSVERNFIAGSSSISFSGMGSRDQPSELEQSGSRSQSSLQVSFDPSGKRYFLSKPVYPLVFCNPVSECQSSDLPETSGQGRSRLLERNLYLGRCGIDLSCELQLHKSPTEVQMLEASPDPNASSRREGFRWSSGSSYDFGSDDGLSMPESIHMENSRRFISADKKCGLCKRPLIQKSPWSSGQIIRNGDMPIAGVLPCSHVFHADCLEETTPRAQIHDPSCPLCHKTTGLNEPLSFSKHLQVSQGAHHENQGTAGFSKESGKPYQDESQSCLNRNPCLSTLPRGVNSVTKNYTAERFSIEGTVGKDVSWAKASMRNDPSSSTTLSSNSKRHAGKRQTLYSRAPLASKS